MAHFNTLKAGLEQVEHTLASIDPDTHLFVQNHQSLADQTGDQLKDKQAQIRLARQLNFKP